MNADLSTGATPPFERGVSEYSEGSPARRGSTSRALIPGGVSRALNRGEIETKTLAEWLAVDMQRLLRHVQPELGIADRPWYLRARSFRELGVTRRLEAIGDLIHQESRRTPEVLTRARLHRSDVVRQWAAYAIRCNRTLDLRERLAEVMVFAADRNMSVREVAWMTFRPFVLLDVTDAIRLLRPLSAHCDARIRRFVIEVTRPRSVWGAHIPELKKDPSPGLSLLEPVRADDSKYVQDAVGNWLNDASKTNPGWVLATTSRWLKEETASATARIVRRARRSLIRSGLVR
jgi:3-methyladenine DNA glycosylase AlkC